MYGNASEIPFSICKIRCSSYSIIINKFSLAEKQRKHNKYKKVVSNKDVTQQIPSFYWIACEFINEIYSALK